MKVEVEADRLTTLATVIARSPIVVKRRPPRLPAGFDHTDAAILEWIATEAQRVSRGLRLM
jgi:hypothetical protein